MAKAPFGFSTVQGVRIREVKANTEDLCGHSFSAFAISLVNERLDESLEAFAGHPLEERISTPGRRPGSLWNS